MQTKFINNTQIYIVYPIQYRIPASVSVSEAPAIDYSIVITSSDNNNCSSLPNQSERCIQIA